jgi:DICT domain-containing protein
VVCDSAERSACLVGWERPGQEGAADRERLFETIWTVDRDTVRAAAGVCCELAADDAPDEVARASERLAEPVPRSEDELASAEALTSRMVGYLTSELA